MNESLTNSELNNQMKNKYQMQSLEVLFFAAYILCMVTLLIDCSLYRDMESFRMAIKVLRYISYIICALKLLLESYKLSHIIAICMIELLLIVGAYYSGERANIFFFLFIAGARNIDFRKIIKVSFYTHIACMIFIMISSFGGIIENRVFIQGDRVRHSLGYTYSTSSSNFFFFIILMYIYLRKYKIKIQEVLAISAINTVLFILTDTRNAYYLGMIVLFAAYIIKVYKIYNQSFIYKCAVIYCTPVFAFISYLLSEKFDRSVAWMSRLNDILNTRLRMASKGLEEYGVKLFGQPIQWIGVTESTYADLEGDYNFVDSSYMQILLWHGLLILCIVCLAYIILGKIAIEQQDIYLGLIVFSIAARCLLDPQLIRMTHNPFLLFIGCMFTTNPVRIRNQKINWSRGKLTIRLNTDKEVNYG